MHQSYFTATGWLSLFAGAALSWVVLSATVREGIVIKTGLICMVAGLFSTAALTLTGLFSTAALTLTGMDSMRGLLNAGLALRLGLCIVIAGYWLKTRRAKHFCLRASDWRDTSRETTT